MSDIDRFFHFFDHGEMDVTHWLMGLFVICALIISIASMIGKISEIIGRPVSWVRKRDKDHDDVIKSQEQIKELKKKQQEDIQVFNKYCRKTEKRIDDIYDMLLDTKIDSQRSQIINFAAQLSIGMKFHKDAFDHIYQVHGKYQKLLQENGMKNGVVDASMKIIDDKFNELINTIK